MLAAIALALVFVALCVGAGRLVLHGLGAKRVGGLSGAVGFAALTIAAGVTVRLPGHAATAAVMIVIALGAGLIATRRSAFAPPRDAVAPAAVVAIVLAAGSIPFLLGGHGGVLGEGIYTNDHAAQLYWTDWLQNGLGPEPSAVAFGYPVGPQSLVAVVSELTGASLLDAFNGLLLAIPALTGLTALALLRRLAPPARVGAAALTGLPFLGASFLAQSAFKETAMALLVLAFAATLALASGEVEGPALGRRAALGAGALIAVAGVFAYSVPALAWYALTLVAWLGALFVAGGLRADRDALRETLGRNRVALGVTAMLMVGLVALSAGPISEFAGRIGDVQASTGRLSSPVFPGEVLGLWPEGDFRIVRGEVAGSLLATGLGLVALAAGALVILRRRGYALLAALAAGVAVYIAARAFASIYVEAKALAVMAPLVVAVTLGGLLSAAGRGRRVLAALGALVALGMAASTLLALREAPVGFTDRGDELEALAERIEGEAVAFLGVDRFAAYWLRGTLIESPGGYVPPEVRARPEKVWQQGDAMDLDTLPGHRLDDFRYAITTTAAYQSAPPPNLTEVARTDSYILWEREGPTPRLAVLPGENGDPGVRAECPIGDVRAGVSAELAALLPPPVARGARGWSLGSPFDAPASASRSLPLRPGRWQLSLQYHSQVDLTVSAPGLRAELPASLAGMYLTSPGRGSFWPLGEVEIQARGADAGRGSSIPVEVSAAEPSGLERAVSAPRRVWLGRLAATRLDPFAGATAPTAPLARACGRYVDHFGARRAIANLTR